MHAHSALSAFPMMRCVQEAPSTPAKSLRLTLVGHIRESPKHGILSTMPQNRHRGSGHPLSPATPPYMRVRIRRFDKLVPPMNWRAERSQFGNAVRVSLLWSASFAASPRRAYQRPTEVGWLVHYPHRDPSTTDPSYRSGLRHGGDYYALC
jgi:hypothetical protein